MTKFRRDPAKEARWRARFKRHATSGLSVRAFCRHEQVTESAFYFWRRVIAKRDGERTLPSTPEPSTSEPSPASPAPKTSALAAPLPSFVPVSVTGPAAGTTSIAIELAGGRVLRLPESISAARLAELVHALESRGEA